MRTRRRYHYMIEYVKGEVAEISPAYAVIETAGIGYGVNISLNTFSEIQGKTSARLWIYEAIREDAYVLFGFATKAEREMFLLLISVSGVGPNTARVILSELTVGELYDVIVNGDERALKAVKGIGLRTAQRLIVDLKEKVAHLGEELRAKGEIAAAVGADSGRARNEDTGRSSQVKQEAIGALTMLGFSPAPTAKVVTAILKEQPDLPVEQVVKIALKQIRS